MLSVMAIECNGTAIERLFVSPSKCKGRTHWSFVPSLSVQVHKLWVSVGFDYDSHVLHRVGH